MPDAGHVRAPAGSAGSRLPARPYRGGSTLTGSDKAAARLQAMARLADGWAEQRQQCIDGGLGTSRGVVELLAERLRSDRGIDKGGPS